MEALIFSFPLSFTGGKPKLQQRQAAATCPPQNCILWKVGEQV